MAKPLPPALPAREPDERLVASLAAECGLPSAAVRAFLNGSRRPPPEQLQALRAALWRPLGGAVPVAYPKDNRR